MVAVTQSILTLLPLAVYIQAWSIAPQSGAQCEDPDDGVPLVEGNPGMTSGGAFDWCERNVNVWGSGWGIRMIQVKDWDDDCDIAVWNSNDCVEAEEDKDGTLKFDKNPIKVYKWEDHKAKTGNTTCLMNVHKYLDDSANPPAMVDFVYDCEGVLRGIETESTEE
ncbi:hypothetical protein CC79DRAFT_1352137 [Sarocladium strictum]